jgi:hypothetical protein
MILPVQIIRKKKVAERKFARESREKTRIKPFSVFLFAQIRAIRGQFV